MTPATATSLSEVRTPSPIPRLAGPAHRIMSGEEAIAAAHEVAAAIAPEATERDRDHRLPFGEMDRLSQVGLLAITVPRAFGGAEVSPGELAEVIATLAAADGSIGQIPQNHYFILEAVRLTGDETQKRNLYDRILAGDRIGNALSESGTKTAQDHATRILRDGDGYRIDGRKFYSTGVLFAHWIAVVGNDESGRSLLAILPRDTPGVTVIDDWSGFGQRTTGSGSTILENVRAPASAIYPIHRVFETPTPMGPLAQIMHAAIDLGIARGALDATVRFVRTYTRPWKESGVEHGFEDPHIIADIGNLKVQVDAADALVQRSARFIEEAVANPTAETVAAASIAVAEGKVAATDASLLVGSKLIELGGSRAVVARQGLDRYWRDARTHTVHDPVRWKYRVIGNYWLNGVKPPRHGAL
jgi:SfnB family sulfur acquisition oxidoreductase